MWGWGSLRQRGEAGGSGHIDRQVVQSMEVVRDIQEGGQHVCSVLSCGSSGWAREEILKDIAASGLVAEMGQRVKRLPLSFLWTSCS